MAATKPGVVTTSWDDGHPLDLRVAELLCSYGVKGTFYVPIAYTKVPRMSREEIRELRRMGMEIGSHTRTHPRIHRLERSAVLLTTLRSRTILSKVSSPDTCMW